jgi:hypothetical protein
VTGGVQGAAIDLGARKDAEDRSPGHLVGRTEGAVGSELQGVVIVSL